MIKASNRTHDGSGKRLSAPARTSEPARRRFEGRTAVVTGAAQGIGRETALAYVVLADRSKIAHEVADEARAAGGNATVLIADVEQYAACRRMMNRAAKLNGRIDVLVNNVGGTIRVQPFEHYTEAQIVAEINRSLYPTLWCCHAVLPHMLRQGGGAIVNVSSTATRGVHRVPYSAAKGGVNALTTCLAFEYAQCGIRVNAVAPGGTDVGPRRIPRNTEKMNDEQQAWYQAIVDQTISSTFLKRYGTPDEQAAAILFLASAEAAYITGITLPVAGGDTG
jgi:dihydroxycyclohexadiene carboxylate dehydrogenase